MKKFLADVKKVYDEKGNCLVAVSEGIHYADGSFVSEAKTSATDGFGHAQLGGLASMLADTVKNDPSPFSNSSVSMSRCKATESTTFSLRSIGA